MMVNRWGVLAALAATAWGVLATPPAGAQEYPSKDIRILCNFRPGTSSDVFVRFYAERLSAMVGRTVKVENRIKNDGLDATQTAASAKPDGYTLLLTPASATLAATVHMVKKPKFDPLKDFAPVTTIARMTHVVLVNPKSSIRTIADLTAYETSRKNTAAFGANTNSSVIAAELYNKLAGLAGSRVQATTALGLVNALNTGDADFVVLDVPTAAELVKNGSLRPLAVTAATRASALPDVPTMEEAGVAGYGAVDRWWGVFAPAKTPQPVLDKLESVFNRIVTSAESQKFLSNVRAEPLPGSAKTLEALLTSEVKRWGDLVRTAGLEAK